MQKTTIKSKYVWLFSLITAGLVLLFGSMSSPLYPFNTWNDVNCFLTVGRSIFNGKVLYRDIFEQKGLYLYTVYGLGTLISKYSFLGAFIMEVLAMTVFVRYAIKLMTYYISPKKSMFYSAMLMLLLCQSDAFQKGGSAEEFCLPLLMIFIVHMVEYCDQRGTCFTVPKFFADGLIVGVILWTKYNVVLFMLGGYIVVGLYFLIKKKVKLFIIYFLVSLFGIIAASIPAIIYFWYNTAFSDMFMAYFGANIQNYHMDSKIEGMLIGSIKALTSFGISNALATVVIFFGVFWATNVFRKKSKLLGLSVLACFFTLLIGVIIIPSEVYVYYPLPLMVFLPLGCIFVDNYLCMVKMPRWGYIVSMLVCVFCSIYLFNGTFMIFDSKDELMQYKFAKEINKTKDPKVLCFGCLDAGIYTAAQVEPAARFFCKLNLVDYEPMINEQHGLINQHKVDYIIDRTPEPVSLGLVKEPREYGGYELIMKESQELYANTPYIFYLYRKK